VRRPVLSRGVDFVIDQSDTVTACHRIHKTRYLRRQTGSIYKLGARAIGGFQEVEKYPLTCVYQCYNNRIVYVQTFNLTSLAMGRIEQVIYQNVRKDQDYNVPPSLRRAERTWDDSRVVNTIRPSKYYAKQLLKSLLTVSRLRRQSCDNSPNALHYKGCDDTEGKFCHPAC